MESLGLAPFKDAYRRRRVLVTGHTGFKGSWLALWLTELGADVTGLSLAPPTAPNHWDLLGLRIHDYRQDIRDAPALAQAVDRAQPEIVFHLAAQSIVRRSYADPVETWATNVLGTANLLDACRRTATVRAIVVATSDKCYEDRGLKRAYRETDRLGGYDPYSASKAAAEVLAASYRSAFFGARGAPLLATVRAGNAIGGGDWSQDRLLPDLVRAVAADSRLEIRSPNAVRPWQHVLEPLAGYLSLGQRMLARDRDCATAWNFGPEKADHCSVVGLLAKMRTRWPGLAWRTTRKPGPRETRMLALDSSNARKELGWRPVWSLDTAIGVTADWYRHYLKTGSGESRSQLHRYIADANRARVAWVSR
ncbi:MAG TPA: CDP-glucose 4,6-dehydratase [Casimicrobiaceae bacterium]|nr:CDP-glucose 4,6-dehydratase [Casimicrobiaceae bacterium]